MKSLTLLRGAGTAVWLCFVLIASWAAAQPIVTITPLDPARRTSQIVIPEQPDEQAALRKWFHENRHTFQPMPLPEWRPPAGIAIPEDEIVSYNPQTGEVAKSRIAWDRILRAMQTGGSMGPEGGRSRPEGSRLDNFTDLTLVNDPEVHPWSVNCKLFMTFPSGNYVGSGVLIDAQHVLTAGHCVYYQGAWATSIEVVPAYENGAELYGDAFAVQMHSWSGWVDNGDWNHDMGVIDLGRPVGALTGWHGYGYNDDNGWFSGRTFHNPGYPAASPYTGQYMYYWYGTFDDIQTYYLQVNRQAFGGQSGSGAYYWDGGSGRWVYAVLSNGNTSLHRDTRITGTKFGHIGGFISADKPATFDLVAMDCNVSPSTLQAGLTLTSLDFLVHNYSTASWSGSVPVDVYLSTNDYISTADVLLASGSFTYSFGSLSSVRVNWTSPPTIDANTTAGSYWIGVILNIADYSAANNSSSYDDAAPITITACPSIAQATLTTPANGATVCSGVSTQYCWNSLSGISQYRVQWDDNSSFSSPEEITTTSTCVYRTLTGSGTWYWRGRGESACRTGTWASYRTITLTTAPGQATLTSPASGTNVCSGASQQYCWNAVSGATTYRVQWDDNSSFSSPLETTTSSTCVNYSITGSGTWYWRARAENVCGNGSWASYRTINLIPVPGQATLASPSSGATVCSGASQQYCWNAVSGATLYRIQWDDNTSFSSPVENTTSSTCINQSLTGSGTWYWRVRAENVCGNGNWASYWTINLTPIPGQATLSSPAEGAMVCSGTSQQYCWGSVGFATTYRAQWDDNTSFSSPEEATTASTCINRTLTGSGTWYWRVRAENACGTGTWATYRSISLTPAPGQASLSSPADGATVCSGVAQQYCWGAVSWATTYRVQWDDNTSFSSPEEVTTSGTCYTHTLTGSGTWYWRVRAENACGTASWSGYRSINLLPAPDQATLTSPAEGTSVCSGIVQQYCWNAVSGATTYRVQWDDNSSFSSPVEYTTSSTCYSTSLTGSGTWYWRVRAENACGSGLWATYRTIVLVPTPAQAALTSPGDGTGVCSGNPMTYCWSSVAWATLYRVQWDDNIGFSSPAEITTTGTCWEQTLTGSGTWYWRVRGENGCGNGAWSVTRTVVLLTVPAQTSLLSPPEGAGVMSGDPQEFCWSSVGGATGYAIQWDDNSSFSTPLEDFTAATCITRTLTGEGTWYWRVYAANSCGNGPWSPDRSFDLLTLEPPVVVIWMDGATLRLAWDAVPGATSYLVQYADTPDGSYAILTTTTDTTVNLATDTSIRFYRVIAER